MNSQQTLSAKGANSLEQYSMTFPSKANTSLRQTVDAGSMSVYMYVYRKTKLLTSLPMFQLLIHSSSGSGFLQDFDAVKQQY